jgi:KRAB domain-containing zinc finger protein
MYCRGRSHLHGQKSTHTISVNVPKRTNTGDNSYEDERCGPKCTVGQSLFKQQTINTEEKRYVCNECCYKSTRRYNLVEHTRKTFCV